MRKELNWLLETIEYGLHINMSYLEDYSKTRMFNNQLLLINIDFKDVSNIRIINNKNMIVIRPYGCKIDYPLVKWDLGWVLDYCIEKDGRLKTCFKIHFPPTKCACCGERIND